MKTPIRKQNLQKRRFRRNQGGFSLIELLIAVIIIGVLAAIAIAGFGTGATNNARALAITNAATKLSNNWVYIAAGLGVSSNIVDAEADGTGIFGENADGADTVLELLMENDEDILDTNLQTAFQGLGTRGLQDLGSWNSTAEEFTIDNYTVTMTTNDITDDPNEGDIQVIFDGVPQEIADLVAAEKDGDVDNATGVVRYQDLLPDGATDGIEELYIHFQP